MPLWQIYSHPSTFSHEQRKGISRVVTNLYETRVGLPSFYVNVLFIDLNEDQIWIGGESKKNFVRIVIEQIARTLPNPDTEKGSKYRKGWLDMINLALKPYIQDRSELEWEYHICETPRDLWRIQGFDPPPTSSEAEKVWVKENRAVPYQSQSNI